MKMIDRIVLIITLLALFTASPTDAQTSQRNFSFNPHPLDQTNAFSITEFGYGFRFGNHTMNREDRSESEMLVSWELGYMRNVTYRWALGVAAFLNADDWRTQFGIKPRVRYWLNNKSSLDFAVGPILKTWDDDNLTYTGISSHLGFNLNYWLGLDAGFEYVSFEGTQFAPGGNSMIPAEGDRTSFSLGARIGGVPGAFIGVAVPAVVAALIYIVLNDDDS